MKKSRFQSSELVRRIAVIASAIAIVPLCFLSFASSTRAASGTYVVVGTNGPATNGQIFGVSGGSISSSQALPAGPSSAYFPAYNPTSGYLMYGAGSGNNVGVFDLETEIDLAGSAPVTTSSAALGGILSSEWAPDLTSGKFLSGMRGGGATVQTFDPTTGIFTAGATTGQGIPEGAWIYNGLLYSTEETNGNVWTTPVLAGGSTAGAMTFQFALGSNGVPNSQGSFNEFASADTASDGTTLFGNFSTNLYLFDIDLMPGAAVTTVDLMTVLTTSGGGFTATDGYISGVVIDHATDTFYVVGAFRDGNQGYIGRDFLISVDKLGNVTPLLQEINGDTVVTGDAYGVTVASFGAVPEPSSFALAALGLVGLGWFGVRRRKG